MDFLAATLRGWTPVWVRARGGEPSVDWALVDGPFRESFFEQTADRAMRHPFNAAFARRTPLSVLEGFSEKVPSIEPAGFVFHMSRSGSTLIARMLAQLADTIVLSEAQPLDAVLRLRARGVDDDTLATLLRGVVSALAQPRYGERRLFVKFHAWHVLALPLIARAFPDTPWVFAFREPGAVLRSQSRIAGAELDPALTPPAVLGLDGAEIARIGADEYGARVIGALCDAALGHAQRGRSAFVDYDTLPTIVLSKLASFFGVDPCEEEAHRMRAIAQLDAKNTSRTFHQRSDGPLSDDLAHLAARFLDPPYAALRAAATV